MGEIVPEFSVNELLKLGLALRNDPASLLGKVESSTLEAKSTGYDLASEGGRVELAKDVSAFANADGGYLVIGVETEHVPSERIDRINSLPWIDVKEFDTKRYLGVIKGYISPKIKGLECGWIPSAESDSLGIGYIRVPPQHPDDKPFIQARLSSDGEALKQIVFGLATRSRSENIPMSAEEIRRALQKGTNLMSVRLAAIEEKLDILIEAVRHPVSQENATTVSTIIADLKGEGK